MGLAPAGRRRAYERSPQEESYLKSQFPRIKFRRSAKKTILAVAASMLTAAYYMLRDNLAYQELGAQHFDRRDKFKIVRRLVQRLTDLGCEVEVRAQVA